MKYGGIMKNVMCIIMLSTVLLGLAIAVPWHEPEQSSRVEDEDAPLQTRDYEEFLDEGCCD